MRLRPLGPAHGLRRRRARGGLALIGAVLAGGSSSRFPGGKLAAELDGRPLLSYPVEAMRGAFDRVAVVAKPGLELPSVEAPVWGEEPEPRHPLTGIVAALRRAAGDDVFACAGDLPRVTSALARAVAARLGDGLAAVPAVGDGLQPLFAAYAAKALPALEAALARQPPPAMRELASELGATVVSEAELAAHGDPAAIALNVNTPAELAALAGS